MQKVPIYAKSKLKTTGLFLCMSDIVTFRKGWFQMQRIVYIANLLITKLIKCIQ
jgi:hypothetical protein